MQRTIELLDAAKAAAGTASDYSFGKAFGFSIQSVSDWRQGRKTFGDDAAEVIAQLLNKEPGEIIALCHAEQAKTEKAKARWLRVAALVAASVLPPAAGASTGATGYSFVNNPDNIYIMRRIRRFLIGDGPALA